MILKVISFIAVYPKSTPNSKTPASPNLSSLAMLLAMSHKAKISSRLAVTPNPVMIRLSLADHQDHIMCASNSAESVLLRTRTSTPCCYRSASHDAAPRNRSESDEGSGRRCWSQKTRTLLRHCRKPWCDEGRHDGPRNERSHRRGCPGRRS